MKSKIRVIALLFIYSLFITGCVTYHLSTQSLVQQLASTQKEKKVNWLPVFPLMIPFTVSGNSLREITVLDKDGKEYTLPVSRAMGVHITKKDGTKKQFYFDTLIIHDSIITGKNDHFIGVNIKPINLNDVVKIEIRQ